MSLYSANLEAKTAYKRKDWKEDCIFCSRAGNCGAELVEWCPLIDKED